MNKQKKKNPNHIHIYVKLKNRIDVSDCRFADVLGFHGNYQGCRSAKNVARYCAKEGDYVSNFDVSGYTQGVNKKRTVAQYLVDRSRSLAEVVKEFPEMIFDYKKLKLNLAAYDMDANPPAVVRKTCTWYYGKTKLGKTWRAMEAMGFELELGQPFPKEVYNKDSNNFKWWENYAGEKYVLVDEIPLSASSTINYLKKWTDKVPCTVEIKGGQTWLRATHFAFTSQHSIDEIFKKGVEKGELSLSDIKALKRRILVMHVNGKLY